MDGFSMLVMAFLAVATVNADMYLQMPRGSNNRLDENNRERRNANRLFDSQNNNRGGYNTGSFRNPGSMYYYAGSKLKIQWTNQHSCADPNANCEIIVQYMCSDKLRDGTSTRTIRDSSSSDKKKQYGMHEDYASYYNCKTRERNKGLFTANQKLKGTTAKYTRQNAAGTRRGFECPEERDYYPYWQPSAWKDVVVMTNDVSKCTTYTTESQNTKARWVCDMGTSKRKRKTPPIPITQAGCEKITGATWKQVPAHNIPAPDCQKTPWSRDNHQGNGVGGFMNSYEWTVPDIEAKSCALRIRYNISTNDFDTWNTFADKNSNNNNPTGVRISELVGLDSADAQSRGYTFKNNPVIQPFGASSKLQLRLAINTAQYGRTFQDRSHSFEIRKRPAELNNKVIHNLNVRGKRGNIVQTFPAVEYDFAPNKLEPALGDYVHIQWTGSNNNPGNNAGQGKAKTDRSNIVLLKKQVYSEGREKASSVHGHLGRNFPQTLSTDRILGFSSADALKLAILKPPGGTGVELDKGSPYFDMGAKKITSAGIYYYMCTRNNNFSNRSQKGKIVVASSKKDEEEITAPMEDTAMSNSVDLENTEPEHNSVRIEELSSDEAEQMLSEKGGKMDKEDAYASKYVAVYPMEKLAKREANIMLNLKVDKNANKDDIYVYHSKDLKSWSVLDDNDIKDGVAKINIEEGGLYVARVVKTDSSEDLAQDENEEEGSVFTADQ